MNKRFSLLINEDGSVIVITLMVLVLLTIAGLASIRTANTEIEIARAEFDYQRNFYLAEGAAMEAANRLGDPDFPITLNIKPDWIVWTEGALNEDTLGDYWESKFEKCLAADPAGGARYSVAYVKQLDGLSPDGNKKMHKIIIYGRSEKGGVAVVRLGYKKAF